MMHTLSLALTPTYTIGLNKNFKFPKTFEVVCNSKPSAFAYPKKLEEKKEEKKKRVETVTLSITTKEKARQARKRVKEENASSSCDAMDVENLEEKSDKKKIEGKAEEDSDQMTVEKQELPEKKTKKKREPEATSFRISNPSRVTTAQSNECEFDMTQRYRPIRVEEKPFGVIILIDSTPGEAEDLGAVKAPSLEPDGECAPPEPFEWTPPEEIVPKEEPSKDDETAMKSSSE
jgi:26S proteasome regulatory subunit N2